MTIGNIILGAAALGGVFTVSVTTGVVQNKAPLSVEQCNAIQSKDESAFRQKFGYDLTFSQRNDFLHIGKMNDDCREKARHNTPTLQIAGLDL